MQVKEKKTYKEKNSGPKYDIIRKKLKTYFSKSIFYYTMPASVFVLHFFRQKAFYFMHT